MLGLVNFGVNKVSVRPIYSSRTIYKGAGVSSIKHARFHCRREISSLHLDSSSSPESTQHLTQVLGLGLLLALPPPLFIRPAKNEARASFCDLPSTTEPLFVGWPGVVGSGVW